MFPTNGIYYKVEKQFDIKNKLKKYKNLAIQGEIIGQNISNGCGKNLYGYKQCKEVDFYVYNIVDTKTRKTLPLREIIFLCTELDLKMVPILDTMYTLGSHSVADLEKYAIGKSIINADTKREGIVVRDIENKIRSIRGLGDSLSFKVINPEFLIQYGL